MKLLAPDHLPARHKQRLTSCKGVEVSWLSVHRPEPLANRLVNALGKRLLPYRAYTRLRNYTDSWGADLSVNGTNLQARSDWDFDALLATWMFDKPIAAEVIARLPRLTWVHSTVTGLDHFDLRVLSERGIQLSSPRGVHARRIAEFVVGLIYAESKNLPEHMTAAQSKRGRFLSSRENRETSVSVIGLGSIGKATARLALSNGMKVAAYRRSPDVRIPDVSLCDQLVEALRDADVAVIALPATPSTRNLISREELHALKRGSTIINVGRASTIDHAALLDALRDGQVCRAYLDVIDDEITGRPTFAPPRNHPVFAHPGIVFTGYSSSESRNAADELFEDFFDKLETRLRGDALRDSPNMKAGY